MGNLVRAGLLKKARRFADQFPEGGYFSDSVRMLESGEDFTLEADSLWEALYAMGHPAEPSFRWAHREANAGRLWLVRGADLVELPAQEAAAVIEQRAEDTRESYRSFSRPSTTSRPPNATIGEPLPHPHSRT
jgi:hypothetical protein